MPSPTFRQPRCLVLGNEAAGLPLDELEGHLDGRVSIPMAGGRRVPQRGHGRRRSLF